MILMFVQDLELVQMLTPVAALQDIMAQIVSFTTATVQTSLQPMYAAVMEHVHLQTIVNVQHIIQMLHVMSPLAPEFQAHQVLYAQVMVLAPHTILALVKVHMQVRFVISLDVMQSLHQIHQFVVHMDHVFQLIHVLVHLIIKEHIVE